MIFLGRPRKKNEGSMAHSVRSNSSLNGSSGRIIALWVIILFFGQVLLLSWLGGNKLPLNRSDLSPELQLLPEIQLVPDYGVGGAFSDPVLFTKPNRRGFSGEAWRGFPKVEHQLIDWSEPGRPLVNEPEMLGVSFRKALPDHLPFVADIPVKRTAKPISVEVPPLAVRKASELEIIGSLGKRLLVRMVTLPSLSHGKALRRTQVRIGVNADGYVVSAIVQSDLPESDSLQVEADQRALDLIKGIRFEPNSNILNQQRKTSNRLEWGEAIFHWKPSAQVDSPSSSPVVPVPVIKQM